MTTIKEQIKHYVTATTLGATQTEAHVFSHFASCASAEIINEALDEMMDAEPGLRLPARFVQSSVVLDFSPPLLYYPPSWHLNLSEIRSPSIVSSNPSRH